MKSKQLKLMTTLFLCSFSLLAQEKNFPTDTFRVIKAYQPTLIDVDKISVPPEINDTFKLETEVDYQFFGKKIPVSFEVDPIAPARIKGEPLVRLYNGFAKVAVGNAMIPMAELYYTNRRSKDYAAGVHLKYHRQKHLNQIEESEMSKAHFEVFGKRFWKRNTLEGRMGYDIHDLNYYGFYQMPRLNPELKPESSLSQRYSRLTAQMQLKSTIQDSFNLRHQVNVDYHYLMNQQNNHENYFKVAGNLSQYKNSELYSLDMFVDYNKYDFDNQSSILALKPKISTIGDNFRVNAGLGIYLNAAGDNSGFHFYPLVEVKYNVLRDILIPYAGLKGEVKRNNYHTITLENPFVARDLELKNTDEKYNLYLGIRGTLSKRLSFNISGAKRKTKDDYLYVRRADGNQILEKSFYLDYDEIDELKLKGELVYRLGEKIKIYALGEYFSYNTRYADKAWHRPDLKLSTTTSYNLNDKIIAKLDLYYWGSQYAKGVGAITTNGDGEILDRTYRTDKLAPIFDVNLGFEYRYTKKLSAFIQFNNIGGVKYEKYQDYPLQGFNFWGGLTYGF